MCKEKEILEKAKDLYKRLGGLGNSDARIVRGLITLIEGAKNTEQKEQVSESEEGR